MKLSVCNIAWTAEHDAKMYGKMKELGMEGIEIAPTRIFPDAPYEHLSGARLFAEQLKKEYGLSVASMQSIWYQRRCLAVRQSVRHFFSIQSRRSISRRLQAVRIWCSDRQKTV